MSTVRGQKYPAAQAVVRLLVADDIRQEVGGKLTLVGLFADSVVVLGQLPPEAFDDEGKPLPLAIDSLAFLLNVSGLTGKQGLTITFEGVGPEDVPIEREGDFEAGNRSANFIARFRPFVALERPVVVPAELARRGVRSAMTRERPAQSA